MGSLNTNSRSIESSKKNRERLILVGVVLGFIALVGGGIILEKQLRPGRELHSDTIPKSVRLQLTPKTTDNGTTDVPQSTSFFLSPSPNELLQKLTSIENLNEDVVEAQYTGLKVMWPAYFFALHVGNGTKGTLILDVSEDGFGIVLESEVDISVYPQLSDLESGKKLWIGGEVLAVDRSGTGTVFLKSEHLHVGDDPGLAGITQTKN